MVADMRRLSTTAATTDSANTSNVSRRTRQSARRMRDVDCDTITAPITLPLPPARTGTTL
jgi:hypothetical protein